MRADEDKRKQRQSNFHAILYRSLLHPLCNPLERILEQQLERSCLLHTFDMILHIWVHKVHMKR